MTESTLADLVRDLDAALEESYARGYWPRQQNLTSIIRRYSGRDSMLSIVTSISRDEYLMDSCVKRSQIHPLGFDKIVLLAAPNYQVHLHVWWNHASTREDIHNHRFSFASGVVTGAIRMSSYRLGGSGVTMTCVKEKKSRQNTYDYEVIGDVSVRRASTLALYAGSAYFLDAGELHDVEPLGSGVTATLFIRTRQERRDTTVLVEDGGRKPRAASRERFPGEELRRRLEKFGDVICT